MGLLFGGGSVQAQSTDRIERTLEVEPDGEVELIAERGRVQVRTWERSDVEMAVEVSEWENEQESPVEIATEGSTLRIQTVQADPDGAGFWELIGLGSRDAPRTDYTLRVPATVSLSITTQEGSVDIRGGAADLTVEGYSASVTVRDRTGEVQGATFSGPLRAQNVEGPLTFATFSGDVTVQGPTPTEKHTVASFSGDADLTFPSDAAFDLRTDLGWGGSVTSDFALPDSVADDGAPVPVGGGGTEVAFESFSGSLTLRAE